MKNFRKAYIVYLILFFVAICLVLGFFTLSRILAHNKQIEAGMAMLESHKQKNVQTVCQNSTDFETNIIQWFDSAYGQRQGWERPFGYGTAMGKNEAMEWFAFSNFYGCFSIVFSKPLSPVLVGNACLVRGRDQREWFAENGTNGSAVGRFWLYLGTFWLYESRVVQEINIRFKADNRKALDLAVDDINQQLGLGMEIVEYLQ